MPPCDEHVEETHCVLFPFEIPTCPRRTSFCCEGTSITKTR